MKNKKRAAGQVNSGAGLYATIANAGRESGGAASA